MKTASANARSPHVRPCLTMSAIRVSRAAMLETAATWSGSNACCIPTRKPSPRIGTEIIGRPVRRDRNARRSGERADKQGSGQRLASCRVAMTFGSLAISSRDALIRAEGGARAVEMAHSRRRRRDNMDELIAVREHAICNLRAVRECMRSKVAWRRPCRPVAAQPRSARIAQLPELSSCRGETGRRAFGRRGGWPADFARIALLYPASRAWTGREESFGTSCFPSASAP